MYKLFEMKFLKDFLEGYRLGESKANAQMFLENHRVTSSLGHNDFAFMKKSNGRNLNQVIGDLERQVPKSKLGNLGYQLGYNTYDPLWGDVLNTKVSVNS